MSSFWTSPNSTNSNGWIFNSSLMQRFGSGPTIGLYWNKENSIFSANKTYLIKTKIKNLTSLTENELRVNTSWNHRLRNPLVNNLSTSDGYLYYYSSPSSTVKNDSSHFYTANDSFNSNKGILSTTVIELDWNIIGFSWVSKDSNNIDVEFSPSNYGRGWMLIGDYYFWFYSDTGINPAIIINNNLFTSENYLDINCLYKFIPSQRFNLEFYYRSEGADLDIYLSENPPYSGRDINEFNNYLKGLNKILSITENQETQKISKFSLTGNQYIIIVSKKRTNIGYNSLDKLKVSFGYHPENNKLQTITDANYIKVIQGATFSAVVGDSDGDFLKPEGSLSGISSKIGNGTFTSGIWENGVWNNGWRKDEQVKEFLDIEYNIKVFSDNKWQIKLVGFNENVKYFKKGDLVSIGNIVAIDINEERKQLIDAYRIVDLFYQEPIDNNDYKLGTLIIEIETIFPVRRIEKDSPNHRILVTKNIWLSGAFFNGYFSGVWNYGLIKGYPLITEMYNTHWKEGFFEGGHFNSKYISEKNQYGNTFYDDTKLGIISENNHNLKVGDIIIIDKFNKFINPLYDGEAKVIKIKNKKQFVIDKDFNDSEDEGGFYYNYISSSVIQNMNFKSENISKVTSNLSLSSTSVFSYNSWIDTNYNTDIAVNIGKSQNLLDPISKKSYAENNLYGYETKDVLSSISEFRNSYSIDKLKYKLGTKYKVYKNYIGDASLFQEYFDTNNDIENFIAQGWTYSTEDISNIRYQRTIDEGIENIVGQELKITATASGGVLNIVNNNKIIIDNRETTEIEKNRYSKIEFELVKNNSEINNFILDEIDEPILHFNNLNYTTRDSGSTQSVTSKKIINTSLPIYDNINLLDVKSSNKKEYFYNKRNLSLYLRGNGENGESESSVIIKNLNFVETDMIPFFKYFTDGNINKSIQIPYQGIAPQINYENSNFVFLDNIKIGLDSYDVTNTYNIFIGSGSNTTPQIITTQPFTPTPQSQLPPPNKVETPPVSKPTLTISASYNGSSIVITTQLSSVLTQTLTLGVRVTYVDLNNQIVQNNETNITINANNLISNNNISVGSGLTIVVSSLCLIYITPIDLVISNISMCNIE
jgi:hypothetical protein